MVTFMPRNYTFFCFSLQVLGLQLDPVKSWVIFFTRASLTTYWSYMNFHFAELPYTESKGINFDPKVDEWINDTLRTTFKQLTTT